MSRTSILTLTALAALSTTSLVPAQALDRGFGHGALAVHPASPVHAAPAAHEVHAAPAIHTAPAAHEAHAAPPVHAAPAFSNRTAVAAPGGTPHMLPAAPTPATRLN